MEESGLTHGKLQLDGAKYAADLSGKDFEDVFLDSPLTLSHSFLNGTSFKNSVFLNTAIDQTELAEAEIIGCHFEKIDFTGSSFIGASVANTTFRNCNFRDGEWRQSHFANVTFLDCDFNYTTVNLCIFDDCIFSGEQSKHLDNRSVNYNVFMVSKFDFFADDDVVLASNFGFPSKGPKGAIASYGAGVSLEEICLKSSSGEIVISEFVRAIESEFARARGLRLKALRLEFISNIIRALTKRQKMSVTSLIYLENLFYTLAQSTKVEAEALAAMSVLLKIRSLLLDVSMDSDAPLHADRLCRAIDVRYARTYAYADAIELAKILGELSNNRTDTFTVSDFSIGSTSIDMIATQAVTIGATLVAINFALRQANITLVQTRELGKNMTKLIPPFLRKKEKRKRKATSRVSVLQGADTSNKDIALVRRSVAKHGYKSVLLDDKADLTVYYDSNK
jgi:uncharacterized protein YjbI with pentapeptide repeats